MKNKDQLCHYGITGMRWGVRRYQNYDGTLTPEGLDRIRKHYYKSKEKVASLNKKVNKYEQKLNKELKKQSKLKRKGPKLVGDDYLDTIAKNEYADSEAKIQKKINNYEALVKEKREAAEKFIKAREDIFSKIPYESIPQDAIDKGEEFTIYINALQSREMSKKMVDVQNEILKKF